MTLAFGNYDESYPPEILRGYAPPAPMAAARAGDTTETEGTEMEPTAPPPDPGPESNSPEGSVPVDATRTEPDGPAVVAVPAEQLDEAAAGAGPTSTVRAPSAHEREAGELVGEEFVDQPDAGTVLEGTNTGGSADPRDDDENSSVRPDSWEFTVTEGSPGSYTPEVSSRDRPRNITELRAVARPADTAPWARDAYVLVGVNGKRAHWAGEDWHGDESPGYPSAEGDGS